MADPAQNATAQDYMHKMNNALNEICDLVGMSQAWTDPDTIRRRVKDIRTERDTAQARAEGLEAERDAWKNDHETLRVKMVDLEAKHATEIKASSTVNTSLMRQISKAHEALDAAGIPRSAEEDGEPGSTWTLGQRIAALLTPGDGESPAEWAIDELDKIVHGEPRPFACDLDKLIAAVKVMKADIAAVWELWGAGRPMTPGCVYEAAQEHERLNTALHMKLGTIAELLDDAKIPKSYGRDQKGGPIPLPERVSVLIAAHDQAMHESKNWMDATMREAGEATDAHLQLDDLGAPRHAGSTALSISARIRALPGLLRP